ncbi:MAG: hypothetical protein CW338_00270 [Clostridiales bacterium]|nr:hypothetical protein [Clostridiales bacterium]
MKRMKNVLCILLAAVLLAGCVSAAAEEEWQTVYRAFLQGSELPADAVDYTMGYINRDDIPDLLVCCGDRQTDAVLKVYEFMDGKAQWLGDIPFTGGVAFEYGGNSLGMCVCTQNRGIETSYYFFDRGNGFEVQVTYELQLQEGDGKPDVKESAVYAVSDLTGLASAPERDPELTNFFEMSNRYDLFDARVSIAPGTVLDDFLFVSCDGDVYTLSGLLQQYDAVLINFFFIGCNWCVVQDEFMGKAYDEYRDRIAVVAFSSQDNNDEIAAFKKEMGYTFIMAEDSPGLVELFHVNGYPRSYMVGQDYAVGERIDTITEEGIFEEIFESYLR